MIVLNFVKGLITLKTGSMKNRKKNHQSRENLMVERTSKWNVILSPNHFVDTSALPLHFVSNTPCLNKIQQKFEVLKLYMLFFTAIPSVNVTSNNFRHFCRKKILVFIDNSVTNNIQAIIFKYVT